MRKKREEQVYVSESQNFVIKTAIDEYLKAYTKKEEEMMYGKKRGGATTAEIPPVYKTYYADLTGRLNAVDAEDSQERVIIAKGSITVSDSKLFKSKEVLIPVYGPIKFFDYDKSIPIIERIVSDCKKNFDFFRIETSDSMGFNSMLIEYCNENNVPLIVNKMTGLPSFIDRRSMGQILDYFVSNVFSGQSCYPIAISSKNEKLSPSSRHIGVMIEKGSEEKQYGETSPTRIEKIKRKKLESTISETLREYLLPKEEPDSMHKDSYIYGSDAVDEVDDDFPYEGDY